MHPTVPVIDDAEWQATQTYYSEERSRCFGSLETPRGHLPLADMSVRGLVTGLSARVELRQTFVNTLGAPLEATYIFPLPPRAAVTEFRLRVAGREVIGEIKERGQARADYNQAIASGNRAAIAEEDRSGVFNLRVGNLMPGDRAEVELVLTGPLEVEGATATFRFPLVVAPRYIPGRPLDGASVGDGSARDTDAVPDASRISPPVLLPGYPNPVRLSLRLEIDPAGLSLGNLRSALHAVVTERRGSRQLVEIRPGERLNRDFIVRFDVAAADLTTTLFASPDPSGNGGTFCLTAVPPRGAIVSAKPRDVVFLLDRSGSMDGWKIVAARRAVARMIDSLGSGDHFSVMAFDSVIERCPDLGASLTPATDRNRYAAIEFLGKLEARGGTEMYEPLLAAAHLLGSGYRDRERVVVLVTDGQVGNEDQILASLGPALSARLFTVGIDRAVNEGFLRRLAALGAGSCSLVESEERLDEVMEALHRRIGEPVITELALSGDGFDIDPSSIVPHRIPDLFAGAPTIVYGRYRGRISGRALLTGIDSGGASYRRELVPNQVASEALAAIWARGHIRRLEDDYAIGRGSKSDLANQIIGLSLTHRVLCRFTAFVAVDRAAVVNPGGRNIKVVQPVEQPEGWGGKADRARQVEFSLEEESTASIAGGYSSDDFASSLDAAAKYAKKPAPLSRASVAAPRSQAAQPSPPPASVRSIAPTPASPGPAGPPASKRRIAPSSGRTRTGILGRGDFQKEKSESPVTDAAPIALRIEALIARHLGRSWLDAATRLARMIIELEQLLADLRSLGAGSTVIDAVTRARDELSARGDADVEAILRRLVSGLGGPAAPRDDTPFWR